MARCLPGQPSGEPGGENPPPALSRILGILGLPHDVDRDGPVRDALVVQMYRLSRRGPERDELDEALRSLVGIRDERRLLPLRGVRLCHALHVPDLGPVEEAARRSGILTFHAEDVMDRAGKALIREVDALIGKPRLAARTARRVLDRFPDPRPGVVDAATIRVIRCLATGVRARKRGERRRR